jgi:hypothetical protein
LFFFGLLLVIIISIITLLFGISVCLLRFASLLSPSILFTFICFFLESCILSLLGALSAFESLLFLLEGIVLGFDDAYKKANGLVETAKGEKKKLEEDYKKEQGTKNKEYFETKAAKEEYDVLNKELYGEEAVGKKGDKDYVPAKEGALKKTQNAEKALNTAQINVSKAEAALTKNNDPSRIDKLVQDI